MGKKLATTPRGQVKSYLRLCSLRARERAGALKRDNYTCVKCGKKRSAAKGKVVKVAAHHKHGIDWEELIDLVFEKLLQTIDDYETLCTNCHDEEHINERKNI